MKKYIKAIFCVVLLIFLDQWTKVLAMAHLKDGAIPIIHNVFELHYLENTGAAWGMFAGKTSVLSLVTCLIIIGVAIIYGRIPEEKRFLPLRIVAIFITAGAFGNLIDRIFRHYVVDFFYFKLIDFPIFNVADIYVTVSVFIMAVLILFYYSDEELSFVSFKKAKKELEQNGK